MREISVHVTGEVNRTYWVLDRLPIAGEVIRDARGVTFIVAGVVWQIEGGSLLTPTLIAEKVPVS